MALGLWPETAAAIAATCAGVDPQHAAGDVEQAVLGPFTQRRGHLLRRLVVSTQLVGQTGIRVGRHGQVGDPRQDVEVLAQLLRAERAVEADDQWLRVTDAVPERLDGLSGQGPTGGVDDRPADDQRYPLAQLVEHRLNGKNRCLRIQRIEDGLDEQDVGPALDETRSGVAVCGLELLPAHAACRGVADIGADGGSPVRWAERPGHVSRAARIRAFRRVGCLAREACRSDVHLADDVRSEPVVGLGDGRRRERVGGDHVGACIEIGRVDFADDLRLGQAEDVAVATQVLRVVGEALATEGSFVEAPFLEHRAHRPVEDDDPLAEQVGQAGKS